MIIYVVKEGDNVDKISQENGVSTEAIIYVNQLVYPYALAVGQALLLTENEEKVDLPNLDVNGYAYPFINQQVLQETLPFLSRLSVFSYGFAEDGTLLRNKVYEAALTMDAGLIELLLSNSETKKRFFTECTYPVLVSVFIVWILPGFF